MEEKLTSGEYKWDYNEIKPSKSATNGKRTEENRSPFGCQKKMEKEMTLARRLYSSIGITMNAYPMSNVRVNASKSSFKKLLHFLEGPWGMSENLSWIKQCFVSNQWNTLLLANSTISILQSTLLAILWEDYTICNHKTHTMHLFPTSALSFSSRLLIAPIALRM